MAQKRKRYNPSQVLGMRAVARLVRTCREEQGISMDALANDLNKTIMYLDDSRLIDFSDPSGKVISFQRGDIYRYEHGGWEMTSSITTS